MLRREEDFLKNKFVILIMVGPMVCKTLQTPHNTSSELPITWVPIKSKREAGKWGLDVYGQDMRGENQEKENCVIIKCHETHLKRNQKKT